jgi:hypothetical protein
MAMARVRAVERVGMIPLSKDRQGRAGTGASGSCSDAQGEWMGQPGPKAIGGRIVSTGTDAMN